LFESGRVFLPQNAGWLASYLDELASFPNGTYDDQVDSTTHALDYARFHSVSCAPIAITRADVSAHLSSMGAPGERMSSFNEMYRDVDGRPLRGQTVVGNLFKKVL
jgi:hypothetical protein